MPCMTHPWLPEITNRAGSRNALQCLPGAGRCEDEGRACQAEHSSQQLSQDACSQAHIHANEAAAGEAHKPHNTVRPIFLQEATV